VLETLANAVTWTSNFVWGPWTIGLIFGTGLYLTLRYGFVQVRRLGEALANFKPVSEAGAEGSLSPFQAFMTGLAASVGTGNIAGVATAVVAGGPGAVFWIWCYGFFATAIKLSEAILGIRFRSLGGGRLSDGPMYYLRDGMGLPGLAWIYALVAGIAALTTTPFTQPNSIAVDFESQFGISTWISGVVLAVFAWLVVIGGVTSIGRTAEKLAPTMVMLYLGGGLLVILSNFEQVPGVFAMIFREAFSTEAAAGGAMGTGMMLAIRYGLARGIYANEAGYGTAAVAYATARSDQPVQQGLNAMMEVYIVSFVTSSVSALTILVSGVWKSGLNSTALVAQAFDTAIPFGGAIVAICALLFGYTTLIGWGYYGEQYLEYLFGVKIILPYRWIYCGLVVLGAVSKVELVWSWGDLMNGLQVFPNIVGLIGLSGVVAAMLRSTTGTETEAVKDRS
jgi:AGCS family alanine or glycine:cation symporter